MALICLSLSGVFYFSVFLFFPFMVGIISQVTFEIVSLQVANDLWLTHVSKTIERHNDEFIIHYPVFSYVFRMIFVFALCALCVVYFFFWLFHLWFLWDKCDRKWVMSLSSYQRISKVWIMSHNGLPYLVNQIHRKRFHSHCERNLWIAFHWRRFIGTIFSKLYLRT